MLNTIIFEQPINDEYNVYVLRARRDYLVYIESPTVKNRAGEHHRLYGKTYKTEKQAMGKATQLVDNANAFYAKHG